MFPPPPAAAAAAEWNYARRRNLTHIESADNPFAIGRGWAVPPCFCFLCRLIGPSFHCERLASQSATVWQRLCSRSLLHLGQSTTRRGEIEVPPELNQRLCTRTNKEKLQEKMDRSADKDHLEKRRSTQRRSRPCLCLWRRRPTPQNLKIQFKTLLAGQFLRWELDFGGEVGRGGRGGQKKSEEEEAAAKERAAQRQLMAIEELVQSERNYLRLLQVSTVTIRSSLQKLQPPPADLDSMFLYIDDVIDVSGRLISLLDQKQVKPGDPRFLQTLSDRPLPPPPADHPETHGQDSPDYSLLEQTAHTSIALNCRINEYKRFREVADKYKKTETLTIKDKINRLNTHSIAKKTARISQYIKHETGMATKGFLACKTEEFDFDMDGEKAPICYKEITTALRQWILPAFEKRMRTLIHKPLCALRDLLVGPRNLIRKRLDKLLDYELICDKSSLNYDEQAVANTYRTINTLLLNELPQFNGLALQMIWSMLGTFSCLHKDLSSEMEQLFQSFAQQLPHSSLDPRPFWSWAESAVLEGARRLETLCRSVEDTFTGPVVQPLSPSSQRRLKQLTGKHGSGKIYQVMGAVVGSRDLDLNLAKGELVAVISEADTRGDKRRWLVDAGGRRGYAPASKLLRYHQPTEEPPPSPHLSPPEGKTGIRRHSYTPESRPMKVVSQPCFQVIAAYDFTARGNHEVSVRAGEPVRVLEAHDKRGNPEWSLVEARGGQRGYVPSNYLTIMPMRTGPIGTF
ncbi:Rho guanine nucleotide exchange factor 37 [Larimichthys crocea]|uniref:Rho guanine nucleotide exchange factor 37 n=1 Tax=Larimichthys crocea TaxID=215358 RepID=A0A6G0I4S3_LARCR|nr:Rho guanine nucleotide exchange factor 37 [Larimichthys crocea]